MEDTKIECPHCAWEPDGQAYWMCSGCGNVWNTFDTAARCPRCAHQHKITACIPYAGGCKRSAPHLDWYKNLEDILEEEIGKVEVKEIVNL